MSKNNEQNVKISSTEQTGSDHALPCHISLALPQSREY